LDGLDKKFIEMPRIFFYLIGFLFLLSFQLYAQEDTLNLEVSTEENYLIDQRSFDTTQIVAYQNNPDFFYDKSIKKNVDLKAGLLHWLRKKLNGLFENKGVSQIWEVLKYTIFGLLLLFALSKLLGMNLGNIFYKRLPTNPLQYEAIEENIHEMNFNQLIQGAIDQQMYRKAVRLYYLKTLKALSDKEIIQWQINKTNGDYRAEIQSTKYAQSFEEITFLFDYVWYGEFAINETVFKNTQDKFQTFIQQISKGK